MDSSSDPQDVCQEIAAEVRDIAINLSLGRLHPGTFERAVVALEAAKLQRFGFRLKTERLPEGGSRFELILAETGKVCSTLDFDTATEHLAIHQIGG